jgi:molybdopterin-guanine dinucleotide biosynthesis protein A
MGRDKALTEIGGRLLALRVAEEAGRFCDSVSLVGDPALYGALGLKVVSDTFPGQGPLAGIEAALGATAVCHRRCHAAIRAALQSGIRKITDALRRLDAEGCAVRYLPVSNAEPFANLNTPDEVQKYLNG